MFRGFSKIQTGVLLAALALSFALSFWRWAEVDHRESILPLNPQWEFGGRILFDGYGNYAEVIYNLLSRPSKTTYQEFCDFACAYIHSSRPLYPFLVALANFVFRDILYSSIAVNVLASLLSLYLFSLILRRHFSYEGANLFYPCLLMVSHVSIIGMLGRPMSDSAALALLLLAIHTAYLFWQDQSAKRLAALLAVLAAAFLAKTVLMMLIASVPLALVAGSRKDARSFFLGFCLYCATPVFVLLFSLAILHQIFPEHSTLRFILECCAGAAHMQLDAPYFKAAVLFLAISFQAYPVFIVFNRQWRVPRFALHWTWMAFYLAQRFAFSGFNLDYSRGRYGIPLVAGAIILAWPAMQRLLDRRGGKALVIGLVLLNYFVWIASTLKEM
jgi:hypothetical protein